MLNTRLFKAENSYGFARTFVMMRRFFACFCVHNFQKISFAVVFAASLEIFKVPNGQVFSSLAHRAKVRLTVKI